MTDTASKRVLDFTNVKDRGAFNPRHVPAGDYRMKVTAVTETNIKDSSDKQWVFTLQLTSRSQNTYPYRCQLKENVLWKIRNLLIAAGLNVPKKKVNVDPNRVVGREIGATLEDHEYEGKMSSEVVAVFPVSDLSGEEPPSNDDDGDAEDSEEIDTGDASEEDLEELDVEEL